MTFEQQQSVDVPAEAYVWIWLPGATEPVVAGRLALARNGRLNFNYGRSYLTRADAIAIYKPELPLRDGVIEPGNRMALPGCIRDGSPDAWGRRVIINRTMGLKGAQATALELDELTYLLEWRHPAVDVATRLLCLALVRR